MSLTEETGWLRDHSSRIVTAGGVAGALGMQILHNPHAAKMA
jgi:hypothetical protein